MADFLVPRGQGRSQRRSHIITTARRNTRRWQSTAMRACIAAAAAAADLGGASVADLAPVDLLQGRDTASFLDVT